jgi:hypothetical protein
MSRNSNDPRRFIHRRAGRQYELLRNSFDDVQSRIDLKDGRRVSTPDNLCFSFTLYRMFAKWQIVVKFEVVGCRNVIGCYGRCEVSSAVGSFSNSVDPWWYYYADRLVIRDVSEWRNALNLRCQDVTNWTAWHVKMVAPCPFWTSRTRGPETAPRRVRTQSPYAPPVVGMREVQLAVCLAALLVKAEHKLACRKNIY